LTVVWFFAWFRNSSSLLLIYIDYLSLVTRGKCFEKKYMVNCSYHHLMHFLNGGTIMALFVASFVPGFMSVTPTGVVLAKVKRA
jgi:hypothetical protein